MIDQNTIEARKTVQQYKALNKNTVEKLSRYDPVLRCWVFEKVQTDENASKFALKPKIAPKPVKVAKVSKAKENKVKRASIANSRRTKIYEMYEMGKPAPAIGEFFKLSVKTIRTEISKYRKINGIEFNRPECETYQQVKKLYNGKEFLNITQIAKLLGKSRGTIAFHIDKIRESGETDRVKVKLNK